MGKSPFNVCMRVFRVINSGHHFVISHTDQAEFHRHTIYYLIMLTNPTIELKVFMMQRKHKNFMQIKSYSVDNIYANLTIFTLFNDDFPKLPLN